MAEAGQGGAPLYCTVRWFLGGSPASKFGDPNTPHLPPGICIGAEQGAVRPVNKVFVLGQPLAHITAVVDCGTTVAFGCPTVLVG